MSETIETEKALKLRQQKREYYYRNKDTIRCNQRHYQMSDKGKSNINKAKARYFQTRIKKSNGGCETEAHLQAKLKYKQKTVINI